MIRSYYRFVLLSLLVALLVFAIGCGGGDSQSEGQSGQADAETASGSPTTGCRPGQLAPDFQLTTLDGQEVEMSSLKGNVVIVDFWATWCKPCRMAIPHLQEIHHEYGDKGVTIVAVAMDKRGEKTVRDFVAKQNMDFKVAMNDGSVDRAYCGIFSLPTTFVIGPDGTVHKKYIGYRDKSVFINDIVTLKPELSS